VLQHVRVDDGGRAFDEFFVDQYPRLLAIGLAWTGDRENAADLAQESMARALSDWERVGALAAPGGWTARVMTNLLIDAHRVRRRADRVPQRSRTPVHAVPVPRTRPSRRSGWASRTSIPPSLARAIIWS
jgi:RNA polymerase sigma-70 factor (ECF subfamily)